MANAGPSKICLCWTGPSSHPTQTKIPRLQFLLSRKEALHEYWILADGVKLMTTQDHAGSPKLELLPGVATTYAGPFGAKRDTQAGLLTDDEKSSDTVVVWTETPLGYGPDPNTITPTTSWNNTLTTFEEHQIAALSDSLLPATKEMPAPSAVGIVPFFRDWLSAPYTSQSADCELVRAGLEYMNKISGDLYSTDFFQLPAEKRSNVVDRLISDEYGRAFFVRFRYLLLGSYFTTDIGMQILGYRGNVSLRRPPSISDDTLSIVEEELRILGL
jgi:hypothetical protein